MRTFLGRGGWAGEIRLIVLKYVYWYVFRILRLNLLLNICPEKKCVFTGVEYKLRLAV